jgi:hypothetical protein
MAAVTVVAEEAWCIANRINGDRGSCGQGELSQGDGNDFNAKDLFAAECTPKRHMYQEMPIAEPAEPGILPPNSPHKSPQPHFPLLFLTNSG